MHSYPNSDFGAHHLFADDDIRPTLNWNPQLHSHIQLYQQTRLPVNLEQNQKLLADTPLPKMHQWYEVMI